MGGRGVIRLKYVQAFRDNRGAMRYYFRRIGSSRTPLPGIPGSEDFMKVYQGCLKEADKVPQPFIGPAKGTVAGLVLTYYASPNFKALKASTQTNYRSSLDPFTKEHGHRLVRQMRREKIISIIGGMSDRPGSANKLKKRLRTLVRFAMDIGWMDHDPTTRIQSYKAKEIHTWTEEEIEQFETRWPVGTKQRLAFDLLLYTGQRGSDVREMVWTDIRNGTIRVAQEKTGEKLVIPLHPDLQETLSATARKHAAILATELGASFSPKGFQNYISKAIRKAKLPFRCKAHGLRKASGRRLAEAGCSTKQIGSVTGHKTLSEIERYTRAANQETLAWEAISKISRTKRGQRVSSMGGKSVKQP